jgi:exonuclease III
MRLISWNANCRFRDKIRLFSPKDHDVLIIQECEKTKVSESAYKNAGWDFVWVGANRHKGLGVFVPAGNPIESIELQVEGCRYFLPVRTQGDTMIVGVWAMGGRSKKLSYAGQISQFIKDAAEMLREQKPIIAGDFNSNAIWDDRHPVANQTANNEMLESFGLRSLYHLKEGCAQGAESEATLYMYRDPTRPYHIDYCYLSADLVEKSTMKIGSPLVWLEHSDHMPLFINMAVKKPNSTDAKS